MNLHYSEDQRSLGKALRSELRRTMTGGDGAGPDGADECLARLGVFGLQVPGDAGGLDLGTGLSAVVCEELGRAAARDHYRAAELLADVVAAGGGPVAEPGLLASIAQGRATVEAAGAVTPLRARQVDHGVELTGLTVMPGELARMAFLVVPAEVDDGGREVFAAVSMEAPGLTAGPGPRRGTSRIRADGVIAAAVADTGGAGGMPGRALTRARIRHGAYLLGLGEGAHALSCRWVARRRQFGRALGDYQALAFPLASQLAHAEAVRLLVHRAGWLCDHGQQAALAATEAVAYAAELALELTGFALHVHGAFGLTRGAPVHRYYERAAAEALRWGTPARLWRVAAILAGREDGAPAGA
ncbi:MAG TPA: acyl-CoA dehydrogenase family protein [Streptosporangiaceae bacterium]